MKFKKTRKPEEKCRLSNWNCNFSKNIVTFSKLFLKPTNTIRPENTREFEFNMKILSPIIEIDDLSSVLCYRIVAHASFSSLLHFSLTLRSFVSVFVFVYLFACLSGLQLAWSGLVCYCYCTSGTKKITITIMLIITAVIFHI